MAKVHGIEGKPITVSSLHENQDSVFKAFIGLLNSPDVSENNAYFGVLYRHAEQVRDLLNVVSATENALFAIKDKDAVVIIGVTVQKQMYWVKKIAQGQIQDWRAIRIRVKAAAMLKAIDDQLTSIDKILNYDTAIYEKLLKSKAD